MRLTAELIQAAPAYINPCKQREINLRGFKISALENLGVTNDEYEVLDLSDNELGKLDNFPLLKRMRTLLVHNNRVSKIQQDLHRNLPGLEALMLCNNRLSSLSDLDALVSLSPSLRHLSLLHNPVASLPDYRLYVVHLLPRLRALDFVTVKPKEREAAREKFGPPPEPEALQAAAKEAQQAALAALAAPEKPVPGQSVPQGRAVSLTTTYAEPASFASAAAPATGAGKPARLSPEALAAEKTRLVSAIGAASSLEQVNALQKELEALVANNS